MKKTLFNKIVCVIMLFFCVFSFSGCFFGDDSSSSSGTTTGGSSGGGTGGTTGGGTGGTTGGGTGGTTGGGTGGGSSSETEADYGNPRRTDYTKVSIDDYYEGVAILTDATPYGKFYDDHTKTVKTFKELLDRQITSFCEYLVFGIKSVYGNTAGAQTTLSGYNINILTNQVLGENAISPNTSAYVNTPEGQAYISKINNTTGTTQLNYDNAINGGYLFKLVDESDPSKGGSFSSEVNTSRKWANPGKLTVENLKNEISAFMISSGTASTYDSNLENIDHLGFTTIEASAIANYILQEIIGASNVSYDNALKERFTTYFVSNLITTEENKDVFSIIDMHYYRAYTLNIATIVSTALTTATDAKQHINADGSFAESKSKNKEYFRLFPLLPRVNVTVEKVSDITKNLNSIIGGEDNLKEAVIETHEKFVSLILLPKLDEEVISDFKSYLSDKYGSEVANSYACDQFEVGSYNISLKNANTDDVKVKLKFNVSIESEEAQKELGAGKYTVLNDYVNNSAYEKDNNSSNCFEYETTFILSKGKYNNEKDLASFDLSSAIKNKYNKKLKIKNYNGVEIFKDNKLNEDYFYKKDKDALLKVDNNLFSLVQKTNINGEATQGVNAVFNAKSNYVQINFEYYNSKNIAISPVPIYFMYFSIWT